MELRQMKSRILHAPRKLLERVLGIESKRLMAEVSYFSQRDKRLHPFVVEALSLLVEPHENSMGISVKSDSKDSIFTIYGSDKDTRHSYGDIYLELLVNIPKPRILEIGVGSINDFPYAGLPAGGGLKAFQKIFPESIIVGVDIDPQSIETVRAGGFHGFVADQTSTESLNNAKKSMIEYGPFDLIIDDGFHDPHANVRTLQTFFSLLSEGGTYVIEDIHESLIIFWKVISVYLPGNVQIVDMRSLRPGVDDNILILITR